MDDLGGKPTIFGNIHIAPKNTSLGKKVHELHWWKKTVTSSQPLWVFVKQPLELLYMLVSCRLLTLCEQSDPHSASMWFSECFHHFPVKIHCLMLGHSYKRSWSFPLSLPPGHILDVTDLAIPSPSQLATTPLACKSSRSWTPQMNRSRCSFTTNDWLIRRDSEKNDGVFFNVFWGER